jgi:hypothetical protein
MLVGLDGGNCDDIEELRRGFPNLSECEQPSNSNLVIICCIQTSSETNSELKRSTVTSDEGGECSELERGRSIVVAKTYL